MKAAIITPYKNYSGGVETVNRVLSEILEDKNIKADIISAEDIKLNLFLKMKSKIFGKPVITEKVFKHKKNTYDFIIANGEFGYKIRHPKLYVIVHGTYWDYRNAIKNKLNLKNNLKLIINSYIQKRSVLNGKVIAVSEFVKRSLIEKGISVYKTIENCINTNVFKPMEDVAKSGEYLYVGSYDYFGKGIDILEKLSKKGLVIDCITNRTVKNDFLNIINNNNYSNMPLMYNKYKILIFPSRYEGAGLVALEAMACGLPVVMNKVGIAYKLKDKIPEFVVEIPDEEEFINKINIINRDYKAYSIKARNYVNEFHSFDKYKEEWYKLLDEIND